MLVRRMRYLGLAAIVWESAASAQLFQPAQQPGIFQPVASHYVIVVQQDAGKGKFRMDLYAPQVNASVPIETTLALWSSEAEALTAARQAFRGISGFPSEGQ